MLRRAMLLHINVRIMLKFLSLLTNLISTYFISQDSLILELQRLHTYQALSSSAYLALTTSDPISSAFVLRDELYQLASQEKQFKGPLDLPSDVIIKKTFPK
ncbi:hypothetical protein PHET_00337 [Paragonimus heterotremus]|uniref:Transient receptor ion channel domain-containing protein n=1 Tax=Paragonimus heterotremus TaxID=100268 RepID=A0A8J4WVB5_9TREM|nr:hypothetical protein PHET_00337 [Paragonimus heterotremus]